MKIEAFTLNEVLYIYKKNSILLQLKRLYRKNDF